MYPVLTEQQKTDSQHFPSRQFVSRRPGPSTVVASKNHVTNQINTQLVSMNALFNSAQSQAALQGHSHNTSSIKTGGSSGNTARSSINDMSGQNNVGPGTIQTKLYKVCL